MKFNYTKFKIIITDLVIFTTLINIFLCIKHLPEMTTLLITWIIILAVAVLFLVVFTKRKSSS